MGAPLAGAADDPVAEAEAASSPSCENAKKDGNDKIEDSSKIREVLIVDRIYRVIDDNLKNIVRVTSFFYRYLNFLKSLFN